MMKLRELAALVGGKVLGDGEVLIGAVKGIDEAGAGDLTFVANAKYKKKLAATAASAVLVGPQEQAPGKNLLVVSDPYAALGKVLALLHPEEEPRPHPSGRGGIEEGAVVSAEAVLYPGAYVCRGARVEAGVVLHPGVFVGSGAVIGEGSILYPNVTVYRRCRIGRRVILHAGVVVGSDGFGFARPGRENVKIPQVGYVQIDDDVEIGANTTIDRGTLGRTWIQRGVKIDNLVQIGHNVVVGEYSVIVAQVGVSGSTRLGRGVVVGGQAGIVGHIELGDNAMVAARSGVHKDVPAGEVVAGTPHLPHGQWLKMEACLPRLPRMREALAALEKRLAALENKAKEKERS